MDELTKELIFERVGALKKALDDITGIFPNLASLYYDWDYDMETYEVGYHTEIHLQTFEFKKLAAALDMEPTMEPYHFDDKHPYRFVIELYGMQFFALSPTDFLGDD